MTDTIQTGPASLAPRHVAAGRIAPPLLASDTLVMLRQIEDTLLPVFPNLEPLPREGTDEEQVHAYVARIHAILLSPEARKMLDKVGALLENPVMRRAFGL